MYLNRHSYDTCGAPLRSGWIRVLQADHDTRAIYNILQRTVGIVLQVLAILLTVIFVFGVIGVQLFGNICSPEDSTRARTAIYKRHVSNAHLALQGNTIGQVGKISRRKLMGEGGASGAPNSDAADLTAYSDGLRCLLGSPEYQLPYFQTFNHLGSATVTLFVASMGNGWSNVMIATSQVLSNHPREPGHMPRAVAHLQRYLAQPLSASGQEELNRAALEFPGCISNAELQVLSLLALLVQKVQVLTQSASCLPPKTWRLTAAR